MGLFKSFVTKNKAFRNLFCNAQKSFHTSPTRIIGAVNHSSNSTIALTKKFTPSRKMFFFFFFFFFFCKCYCWVWRMIDSLYCSSRKIPERCENSLVREITKDLNSTNDSSSAVRDDKKLRVINIVISIAKYVIFRVWCKHKSYYNDM